MSVLLIFVDGLGIGERSSANPLARLSPGVAEPLAIFRNEAPRLLRDGVLAMTDACLGVEGRPQSASGQTTILTGVNAPAVLGRHKQGFPNETLREIIRRDSIFLQLRRAEAGPVAFANAYSRQFFAARPRWVSATTIAVEAAGMSFRTVEDVGAGRALYHDYTNKLLREAGEDLPERTPEAAAGVLAAIARKHRFTLYEYFITDRIGHLQDMTGALAVLAALARFVRALLAGVDLARMTIVLTSDHGNIEDLSLRNHTRNLVPTLAWGSHRELIRRRVQTLADITPTIFEILTAKSAVS